jgi:hypothetical protein
VFHGPAFHVSLAEYENLLAGGATTAAEWVASTRVFLRDVRHFQLVKTGEAILDSRSAIGLSCALHATTATPRIARGAPLTIDVIVTNTGTARWLPRHVDPGGVGIGVKLYDEARTLLSSSVVSQPLTEPERDVLPGETIQVRVLLPPLECGRYRLDIDCVATGVTWFSQTGSRSSTVLVEVTS